MERSKCHIRELMLMQRMAQVLDFKCEKEKSFISRQQGLGTGEAGNDYSDADGTPGRPKAEELPVRLEGYYFGTLIGTIDQFKAFLSVGVPPLHCQLVEL